MQSEEKFLSLIDSHFPNASGFVKLGRGDDCAILSGDQDYCVSSDLFIEEVHFKREYFAAEDIGYKALAVNLSDIAGMGAKPVAFTMDLMVPPGLDESFWEGFFSSMGSLARQHDMTLAGGDLSRSDRLGVSISIFGVGGANGFVRRRNCHHGDVLFTVGDLGLARAGFHTLEALGDKGREAFPAAVLAHLRPKPKVLVGTLLNAAGVKSMMDVSDGLARDLPRLLGPDLGAELTLPASDLNGNVLAFALGVGADPVETAVLGGEDYALLGAVSPFEMGKVESVPGFTPIGTVSKTPGVILNGQPFTQAGFDHFGE